MLASTIGFMPVGVHLAIVDPGVGGPRRALALRDAEGRLFVGPDNGLLLPAANRAGLTAGSRAREPEYALESISQDVPWHATCSRRRPRTSPPASPSRSSARRSIPTASCASTCRSRSFADGAIHATLLYVDSFGNIALNLDRDDVEGLGIVSGARIELELSGERYYAVMARTFADARPGDVILYEDSYKKMSLAISRGSAARMLHASPGQTIRISLAG